MKKVVTLLGVFGFVMVLSVSLVEASTVSGYIKDGGTSTPLGGATATFKQGPNQAGKGTAGLDGYWITSVPGDLYYELIYFKAGYVRTSQPGTWVSEPSKDFGVKLLYKPRK